MGAERRWEAYAQRVYQVLLLMHQIAAVFLKLYLFWNKNCARFFAQKKEGVAILSICTGGRLPKPRVIQRHKPSVKTITFLPIVQILFNPYCLISIYLWCRRFYKVLVPMASISSLLFSPLQCAVKDTNNTRNRCLVCAACICPSTEEHNIGSRGRRAREGSANIEESSCSNRTLGRKRWGNGGLLKLSWLLFFHLKS